MNVLVLQLKRIGDLVLTTPMLAALERAGANVTLVADAPCASLLPAISGIAESLAFSRKGGNSAVWKRIRKGGWDVCLDLTGSDRSALMAWLSRAPRRITFQWVRKRMLRRLAYHEFVDSPVRLAHTCDHYVDLLRPLGLCTSGDESAPRLVVPRTARDEAAAILSRNGIAGRFVLIHPGTARPEKYWLPERWSEVIAAILPSADVLITSGPDAFETAHVARIKGAAIVHPPNLLTLSALVEQAAVVASCDTAVVHLAAAFQKPQVALFGPTNPFHWRPRHRQAIVISAADPLQPLMQFLPKMKGAPMERIPAQSVIAAIEKLLRPRPPASVSGDNS